MYINLFLPKPCQMFAEAFLSGKATKQLLIYVDVTPLWPNKKFHTFER